MEPAIQGAELRAYGRGEDVAIQLLKEQVAGLQHANQKLTQERDEFRDALEVIGAERDDLSAKVATPDDKDKRISELQGQIRLGRHRDAFSKLAKGAVKDEAVADLFDLMRAKAAEFGIDPKHFDADEPDAKAYEAALTKARESRPYAFIPSEKEASGLPERPTWPESSSFRPNQTPPVVGSGRGERNVGTDGTIITPEMRADPSFMLNPANRDVIVSAAKEGRFR